jgi:hypothetical protein
MPTALDEGPGMITMFYTGMTGYLECLRVNIEENVVYRLARDTVDYMGVNIVTVSLSAIGISIIHAMDSPGSTQSNTAVAIAAERAYYVIAPYVAGMMDYMVVQSKNSVSLLYNQGGKAFVFVAGAVVTGAKEAIVYVFRKTADMGYQVAGIVLGVVGTIVTAYISTNTNKKRKLLK